MADITDPKIDEGKHHTTLHCCSTRARLVTHSRVAYQDVRSDKTDTNWLLLDYEVTDICAIAVI